MIERHLIDILKNSLDTLYKSMQFILNLFDAVK